jgi:hypothetical protein
MRRKNWRDREATGFSGSAIECRMFIPLCILWQSAVCFFFFFFFFFFLFFFFFFFFFFAFSFLLLLSILFSVSGVLSVLIASSRSLQKERCD